MQSLRHQSVDSTTKSTIKNVYAGSSELSELFESLNVDDQDVKDFQDDQDGLCYEGYMPITYWQQCRDSIYDLREELKNAWLEKKHSANLKKDLQAKIKSKKAKAKLIPQLFDQDSPNYVYCSDHDLRNKQWQSFRKLIHDMREVTEIDNYDVHSADRIDDLQVLILSKETLARWL